MSELLAKNAFPPSFFSVNFGVGSHVVQQSYICYVCDMQGYGRCLVGCVYSRDPVKWKRSFDNCVPLSF